MSYLEMGLRSEMSARYLEDAAISSRKNHLQNARQRSRLAQRGQHMLVRESISSDSNEEAAAKTAGISAGRDGRGTVSALMLGMGGESGTGNSTGKCGLGVDLML